MIWPIKDKLPFTLIEIIFRVFGFIFDVFLIIFQVVLVLLLEEDIMLLSYIFLASLLTLVRILHYLL